MQVKFSDIELAFEFVGSGPPDLNQAVICKRTGQLFFASDLGDTDEGFPEDATQDGYWFVPHLRDLNCGSVLVHEFIAEAAPQLSDEVHEIFSRKGAYSRFRDLMHREKMVDDWYAYEEKRKREAMRKWCEKDGVPIDEAS